jgi:hypothetical protein
MSSAKNHLFEKGKMRGKRSNQTRFQSARYATAELIERRLLMSTYMVNTLSDAVNPGPGLLTLRQAVADASAHSGADTITFSPKVFAPGSLHTITLTQGQIVFTDTSGATTLDGPGPTVLEVNADQHSRVFKVADGVTASMSGLTITGGSFTAPTGALAAGGGVLNNGKLALTNVSVTNSEALGAAGPDFHENDIGDAEGGGVYSNGTLSIADSTVSGNTTTGGNIETYNNGDFDGYAEGGGIYSSGSFSVSGSVISNNAVTGTGAGGNAEGGGIYSSGTLSLNSTTLAGNQASVGPNDGSILGGAICAAGPATINGSTFTSNTALGYPSINYVTDSDGPAWGGAVFSTDGLMVSSSTFTGNQAVGGGGSNFNNDAGGNGYGGAIAATGSLTITGSTLSTNLAKGGPGQPSGGGVEAAGFGGAVYATAALSITSSSISGYTAQAGALGGQTYGDPGGLGEGGGIFASGISTVSDTTVSGNDALGGPGDYNDTPDDVHGGDGAGGGIYSGDSLMVIDSTLAANQAVGGVGGIGYNGYAGNGGSGVGGAIDSIGTLDVVSSTITGNAAAGGNGGKSYSYNGGNGGIATGGGIYAVSAITISDSTIVQNTATGGMSGTVLQQGVNNGTGLPGTSSGGGIQSGNHTMVDNTILSANNAISGADVYSGLSSSSSHNLIGYGGGLTNGVNGNKIGIHNPELMPLGWYGGPTETMLPLANSPVIDAGSIGVIPPGVTTDQRGDPRTIGKSVDIGSVEFGNVTITGTVFNDESASGKQTSSDPGIAGFTVYLDLNHDGKFDAGDDSTLTNSIGKYTFDGLFAGSYTVGIISQTDYRPSTAATAIITASSGATAIVPAFGETQDALISGTVINSTTGKPLNGWRVYIDLNDDGKWESTEPSVVTTSNGTWSFNIADPGTYEIRIVPMNGYKTTAPTGGFFSFSVGKASARIGSVFAEQNS